MREKIFQLKNLNTNLRTEVIAGITTFMTMAYIIFVNPAILSVAGMDFGAVMAATCLSTAIATLIMGFFANYPFALAPGMGMNAYFTYTVCVMMKIPWQVALGCIFIEGLIFIILTFTRLRTALFDGVPKSVRLGAVCGIGLLISLVGLKEAGIIIHHPATFVTLGNLASVPVLVSVFGLLLSALFLAKKVRGALFWGIILTTILALPLGVVKFQGIFSMPPSLEPVFLKLDIPGAMSLGLATIIFVFLFMGIFDTVGTLAGIGELGGFIKNGKLPRVEKCFFSDALGTVIGALLGTSTVTVYIESASGISEGGRSGLVNLVCAILFLAALFFSPLVRMIGGGYVLPDGIILHPVTAPALILVGSMLFSPITKINWDDVGEAIPAFLTIIMMPFTFNIANGLSMGFISYALIKLFTGKGKEVSWLVYVLACLFILKFIYLREK